MNTNYSYFILSVLLAGLAGLAPAPALADRDDGYERNRQPQRVEQQETRRERPAAVQYRHVEQRVAVRRPIRIQQPHSGYRPAWHAVPRQRYYRGIRVYRHHGHRYPGFGFYYSDADAFRWIAFTALSMAIIDHLDEQQQRLHEQAFVRATSANSGDTIYWQDEHSSGSITVTRIWYDRNGRQCRDLEQSVTTGRRTETGLSTVCLRNNGVWVVSRAR